MHRGSYNRLENEKKKETSGSKLRRIAKLLGVPMEALITDD
jgi:transcriptional regulator with XRE-family HTH domain